MSDPSLFPPSAPTLPQFSSILVTGKYHPSAPIHLALSLRNEGQTVILYPSRLDLRADLQRFNDSWLASRSGHGKMTELTSEVAIFYPPSPTHLAMLLSVLCTMNLDSSENGRPWTGSSALGSIPHTIILVEPSKYFLTSNGDEVNAHSNATLPAYLNLVNRAFACTSNLKASSSPGTIPKFALFDSQLHNLKLPVMRQPLDPPEEHDDSYKPRDVFPLVEKYFEWVATFEDDDSFIPSSQGDEETQDDGFRKQLRLYHTRKVEEFGHTIQLQWLEVRSFVGEQEGIDFRW